jgi:hypothetical protein
MFECENQMMIQEEVERECKYLRSIQRENINIHMHAKINLNFI